MDERVRYITKIERNCQIYKKKVFAGSELTQNEALVLHYIRHNEGTSQDSIAKYFEVDKALVTRMIKHLIDLGLVYKKQSEKDKRLNQIFTTEKTKDVKNLSNKVEADFYNYLFEDLSEEEIESFFSVLEKIYIKSKKARKSNYEEIK